MANTENQLSNFSLSDFKGSPTDQLCNFESLLNKAEDEGFVNKIPMNESETYSKEKQQVRLITIAHRLFILGYLPKKIEAKNLDGQMEHLKTAVLSFQQHAGLMVDKWVGPKTWDALDQLVSFESDIKLADWFEEEEIKKSATIAVHRAIWARLFILGLIKKPPGADSLRLPSNAFDQFKKLLSAYYITPLISMVGPNRSTVSYLFNQDFLTGMLASTYRFSKTKFLIHKSSNASHKIVENFAVHCAKIELWLLGYDVKLKEKSNFIFSEDDSIHTALSEFYQYFVGYNTSDARQQALSITPELFKRFADAATISIDSDDDASEELAEELNSEVKMEKAWSYVKHKTLHIWDGMKRIWRWIKSKGKYLINYISDKIKYSAYFRYTSKAFTIIKKGLSKITESITHYVHGGFSYENVCFVISKDMDTHVYFSMSLDARKLQLASKQIQMQSKAFVLGCQIVSWIINILKNVVKGMVGWMLLLWSLLKSYKRIHQLYLDFKNLAYA